jgi:hypothetical protein
LPGWPATPLSSLGGSVSFSFTNPPMRSASGATRGSAMRHRTRPRTIPPYRCLDRTERSRSAGWWDGQPQVGRPPSQHPPGPLQGVQVRTVDGPAPDGSPAGPPGGWQSLGRERKLVVLG